MRLRPSMAQKALSAGASGASGLPPAGGAGKVRICLGRIRPDALMGSAFRAPNEERYYLSEDLLITAPAGIHTASFGMSTSTVVTTRARSHSP